MDLHERRIEEKIGRLIYKAVIKLDIDKVLGALRSEPQLEVEVRRAMEVYRGLVSTMYPDEREVTPLLAAVVSGSVALCRCFIQAGLVVDFNKNKLKGVSYLSLALQYRQYDVAKLLIKLGANVNDFDERGHHVMSYAIEEDTPVAVIEDLLSAGCPEDGDMYKTFNNRPLTKAIFKGNIPVVKCLLQRSVDVNYMTPDNTTPLNLAVEKGYSDVTEMLIQMGSSVNSQNFGTPDPLFHAVVSPDTGCLKVLIKAGAKVNKKIRPDKYNSPYNAFYGKGHTTVLHVAVSHLNYDGAKLLLENGARVNAKTEEQNNTPLHILARMDENGLGPDREVKRKYRQLVQLLLESGADLEAKSKDGCDPVVSFINSRGWIALEELVRFKISPNAPMRDNKDMTMFQYFFLNNCNLGLLKTCVEFGADCCKPLSCKPFTGTLPLKLAMGTGNVKLIKFLLKNSHLDGKNKAVCSFINDMETSNFPSAALPIVRTESQLNNGIMENNPKIVTTALQNGAIPTGSLVGTIAYSLIASCYGGCQEIVEILLDQGVSPCILGKDIVTEPRESFCSAIHIAALKGYPKICKLLLQHGACYNYSGRCEDTPMMSAMKSPFAAFFTPPSIYNPSYSVKDPKSVQQLLRSISRLFKMIRCGNKRVIKILKKKQGSKDFFTYINCINNKGNTLMAEALQYKFTDIAEAIMVLRLQSS